MKEGSEKSGLSTLWRVAGRVTGLVWDEESFETCRFESCTLRFSDVIITFVREVLDMAKPGDTIHIPLKTEDAIKNLLKVKPTDQMPRMGDFKAGKKKSRKPKK